jgi:hypothetical protein
VVFVDARNNTLNLALGNNAATRVLVVWCGNLTLSSPYKGIIISMYGDGTSFGATNCGGDSSKGVFTLNTASNENVKAWLYANGGNGTPTTPGAPSITSNSGSVIEAVPGDGDLASVAFGSSASPPTSFQVDGWREVYQ